MAKRKFHPASDIFPLLEGADFAALVADIKVSGLRESVVLHPDGSVLDGRNRLRACAEADVEPRFRTYDGDDPVGLVVSMNLHRRHLTTSQRSMVGGRLANMRQGARTDLEPRANLPEVSNVDAAQVLNISERSVKNAKAVLDTGDDELIQQVESGEMSVSSAAKRVQEHKKQQQDAALPKKRRKKGPAAANVARAATLRRNAVLARQLYDGLDAITGMPDIETMVKVTVSKHDVVATKVPIAINWLNNFSQALSKKRSKSDGKRRA